MKFQTFQKRLGRQLHDLRKAANLTQGELAGQAGITRQHLQRLEGGTINPTIETLFNIAKAGGQRLSDLVKAAE